MSETHKNESLKIRFRKNNIFFGNFIFDTTKNLISTSTEKTAHCTVTYPFYKDHFLKISFFPDGWKISKVWWAILKMASPICCLIPVYILMFQRLFQVLVISIWTLVIIRCQLLSTLLLNYPFFLANKWIFMNKRLWI